METVPVIVRIETENGACLRRLRVAGTFVNIRDIAEAIRDEIRRAQALELPPRVSGSCN